ncbi:hypothetical protein [Natronosalvus amylolyticus]|uniref:hypothetical protein n=1 Tax=Natronosalvus amylolyticus TaxID=2961994 RepID=UPI0020C9BAEF|nr:hypothetical protein [Natronosalvus amylolyticus]
MATAPSRVAFVSTLEEAQTPRAMLTARRNQNRRTGTERALLAPSQTSTDA